MSNARFRGCGKSPCQKKCSEVDNWYIPCGCSYCSHHHTCDKECQDAWGCTHPLELMLSGTLEEVEACSDQKPPIAVVERAVNSRREELVKKYLDEQTKLDRILKEYR